LRNARKRAAHSSAESVPRNPITASPAAARAASGHAAAPPSSVMKSRRFRPNTEFALPRRAAVDHTSQRATRLAVRSASTDATATPLGWDAHRVFALDLAIAIGYLI
jgi:hypothetical protein